MTPKELAHEFFLGIRTALACPDVSVTEYEWVMESKMQALVEQECAILEAEVDRLSDELSGTVARLIDARTLTREKITQAGAALLRTHNGTEGIYLAPCDVDYRLTRGRDLPEVIEVLARYLLPEAKSVNKLSCGCIVTPGYRCPMHDAP